jgi:molecular chaperone Hsp33
MGEKDSVLRAITDDGAFRVITARTTQTVRGAIAAQHGSGRTARYFAELLTGAVLFRETMAPKLRVQGILTAKGGSGSLVADSHPSGDTRGLIQLPSGIEQIDVGDGALLKFLRTLPSGKINQGVVRFPEAGGVSEALMVYMQASEQVMSMVSVGTWIEDGEVVAAGGYMVQLLPEVHHDALATMTERLTAFEHIDVQLRDRSFAADWLLDRLLQGIPHTRIEESSVSFNCWCSQLRVVSALATLARAEIEALLADGEVLHITCDYCGEQYQVLPAQLRGLLDQS